MLANGADAKTAVAGGLCVMPVRMAYDYFVNKTMPPPPVIAQTLAIVGARRPLLRAPASFHSSSVHSLSHERCCAGYGVYTVTK